MRTDSDQQNVDGERMRTISIKEWWCHTLTHLRHDDARSAIVSIKAGLGTRVGPQGQQMLQKEPNLTGESCQM